MYIGGLDIGGTKCAALIGRLEDGSLSVCARVQFPTPRSPEAALEGLEEALCEAARQVGIAPESLAAIGISCGGPLDSKTGRVLSPPNLPGWDDVPVCERMEKRFGVPCALQNDANACALAEWRFGAGQGLKHMVFLTFGTGLGAGLILDGRLYAGANDKAGEVGHVRLSSYGPVGYGKAGSFEGFCSGGGIAQLARTRAYEAIQQGRPFAFCPNMAALEELSAKSVAMAADAGDEDARAIYTECGTWLGRGLSMLVDILNPEAVVIGSVYARSEHLLQEAALRELSREALPGAAAVCRILPAALGDAIGDYAALSVAANLLSEDE